MTPTKVLSCGICETFKNSGGCLWKHVTYYVIKNYIGHKLAIFNIVLLLYCIIVNPMMRHETRVWYGMILRGTSRQQKLVSAVKRSIAHTVLYWQELIPFYQRISRVSLLFKKLLAQSGNQTYIFWKFYLPAETLG